VGEVILGLPRRYLESVKDHIVEGNAVEFHKYNGYEGAKRLAKDLGETLNLLEDREALYVINHSYNELFKNVYDEEISLNHMEWMYFMINAQVKNFSKEGKERVNKKRNNFDIER